MLEKERDNLRFLLGELGGWKEEGLVTEEQHETLSERYRSRLDTIEEKTSGSEAMYLEEDYATWLVRLGTVAILAAFTLIAALSLGLFTEGQKNALTFIAAGLFCGIAVKMRSTLKETLSNALLFIGCSLLVAAVGLLYGFDYVGPAVEALLQFIAAAAIIKLAERYDSTWVLLEGMGSIMGACILLIAEEVLPEGVVLLASIALCVLFARYTIERSQAAMASTLVVSYAVLGRILDLLFGLSPSTHEVVTLLLVSYSLGLVAAAIKAQRRYNPSVALPIYLVGCAGTAFCWTFFLFGNRFYDWGFMQVLSYLVMGAAFLRLGRRQGQTVVMGVGGLVLLGDLQLFNSILDLPTVVSAMLLLIAGLGVLYAAWRFDVRRRELLASMGAGEEDKKERMGETTEGAMEGLGALLER